MYVAFRVGKDNKCYWPLDKIAEQTRMHKNTVSKCLRWWTRRGVLKATAQLRGPTIYELTLYPAGSDIEPDINIPPEVILDVSDAQGSAPAKSEPDSEPNIPPEVMQYHSPGDPISRQECSNIPSEYPLKELERNLVNEQDKDNDEEDEEYIDPASSSSSGDTGVVRGRRGSKALENEPVGPDITNTVIRELREYLGNCPDDLKPQAIRDALGCWPDWWTKRPEEATSYYLENWDKFTDEVLARSDTQEVEVDPAGPRRLPWG